MNDELYTNPAPQSHEDEISLVVIANTVLRNWRVVVVLLSLEAAAVAPELFWGWVILLGAFMVDATVTLTRRLLRGERGYEAHRSHAYQHAARRLGSHVPVSLAFGNVNLVWLLPVAAMVASGWLDGVLGVLVAYSPLVWFALWWGAGRAEGAELA